VCQIISQGFWFDIVQCALIEPNQLDVDLLLIGLAKLLDMILYMKGYDRF